MWLSMIVNDLHVVCLAVSPGKANPPAIVDPDAERSGTIVFQLFETVTGRNSQII